MYLQTYLIGLPLARDITSDVKCVYRLVSGGVSDWLQPLHCYNTYCLPYLFGYKKVFPFKTVPEI